LIERTPGWRPTIMLLIALPFCVSGCAGSVLDPMGPVGAGERVILLDSLAIMLAIVIPTIVLTLFFAWKFRATNTRAHYRPDWSYSGRLELLVWSIPTLVVLFLGGIAWVGSHDLDPAKPLPTTIKPLEVQVVSFDWKWLFIYPELGVASVNRLVVPTSLPVHFRLTSTTVMNSFFVPQLGSQIYAMAGMATQLNLQADKSGHYAGLSAQFSGAGFSDMRFAVDAMSQAEFDRWVAQTQGNGLVLNAAGYADLAKESKAVPSYTYRAVAPGIFEAILNMQVPPEKLSYSDWPNTTGLACIQGREENRLC
jgi:cytochrome o ubiquinol oxidase subunit 2